MKLLHLFHEFFLWPRVVYQIFCPAIDGENSNPNNDDKDGIDLNNEIKDLEKNLEEWLQLRQETVYCPLISRIFC